jgi:uncharacterized membrane protein
VITLEHIYWLSGLMMTGVAIVNFRDRSNRRRINNTAFWGIYGITFLIGSRLPDVVNGFLVIAMVLVASIRGLGQGADLTAAEEREASARRWGNKLFIPALTIPILTVAVTFAFKRFTVNGAPLVDVKQVTVIALAIATLVALAVGMLLLRPAISAPIKEARRLLDAVGWAAVLPQMLAALGALFALAGVGNVVSGLAQRWIPLDTPSVNWLKKPYVKGMYPNPGSLYPWKYIYIERDPAKWDSGTPSLAE